MKRHGPRHSSKILLRKRTESVFAVCASFGVKIQDVGMYCFPLGAVAFFVLFRAWSQEVQTVALCTALIEIAESSAFSRSNKAGHGTVFALDGVEARRRTRTTLTKDASNTSWTSGPRSVSEGSVDPPSRNLPNNRPSRFTVTCLPAHTGQSLSRLRRSELSCYYSHPNTNNSKRRSKIPDEPKMHDKDKTCFCVPTRAPVPKQLCDE